MPKNTARNAKPLADQFRHICFMGLNSVEYMDLKTRRVETGTQWHTTVPEKHWNDLALCFFTPRMTAPDGKVRRPNPYAFVMGVKETAENRADAAEIAKLQKRLGKTALLDFAATPVAEPNTVNIIAVADVLFYWDAKDNYIQPTEPYRAPDDIARIISAYPESTHINVYSNWDLATQEAPQPAAPQFGAEMATFSQPLGQGGVAEPWQKRAHIQKLTALPMSDYVWLNKPTAQDKFGGALLAAGLAAAVVASGVWFVQKTEIDGLNASIRGTLLDVPSDYSANNLSDAVNSQVAFMAPNAVWPLMVKDVAQAVARSGMRIEAFEIGNPRPTKPSDYYTVELEALKDAYKGWREEEPLAKNILSASSAIMAMRRPPGNLFKLEGLIDVPTFKAEALDDGVIGQGDLIGASSNSASEEGA